MLELDINDLKDIKIKKIIKKILDNNGIIVYPTDTLYGIGGNFFSIEVVKRIDELKERNDTPYSVIVHSIDYIKEIAELNDFQKDILKKNLPGKFTFILKARNHINKKLLKNRETIGIRIPDFKEIVDLVKYLNYPLITTSVNKSGQKPINNPEIIKKRFNEIDILIKFNTLRDSKGSTIVDITNKELKILRFGDSELNY